MSKILLNVELPLPPTTNQLYEITRGYRRDGSSYSGARRLKPEVQAWKDLAIYTIRCGSHDKQFEFSIPPKVELEFNAIAYMAKNRDLDNVLKILIDAIFTAGKASDNQSAGKKTKQPNDNQITRIVAEKFTVASENQKIHVVLKIREVTDNANSYENTSKASDRQQNEYD
jgi:Holliday junction resolvase RusA-like endonuclease